MLSRRSVRRVAVAFGVAAAATAALLAIACSGEPGVNFGSPSGLSKTNLPGEGGAAPLVCEGGVRGDGGKPSGGDGGACEVSWANDIYPKMQATSTDQWACATANCHATAGNNVIIDPNSAQKALDALKNYKLTSDPNNPYIGTSGDPTKSDIECNLGGGCGNVMPPPPRQASDVDRCLLHAWLLCGAPSN